MLKQGYKWAKPRIRSVPLKVKNFLWLDLVAELGGMCGKNTKTRKEW
jgi:hypothetical protein